MVCRSLSIIMLLFSLGVVTVFAESTQASSGDGRSLQVQAKPPMDGRLRVALVVGNSRYRVSPLTNPVNDARAMAAVLRRLGFEVHERIDVGYSELHQAIEQFGNRLKPGGVGLFYYAGHGMQVQGNNYLIPVDARINAENEVRYKAVDAGLVLAKMEQAKGEVNIVILDACRDNPFSRSFRSGAMGLASMDAPTGTLVAYATAPGRTAADGGGQNGLFTSELLRVIQIPGLRVEDVFKQVRKSVREKSGNAQIPWEASSLEGNFYFSPGETVPVKPDTASPLPPTVPPPTVPGVRPDDSLKVESLQSPPQNLAYNRYLSGFPSPLESDRGWGGGSSRWQLVDGQRSYPNEWARGLAFTGGARSWGGESCGWRQVTVDFGKPVTFNRVVLWHHGLEHIPSSCGVQVLQQGRWQDIFSSSVCRSFAPYAQAGGTQWWQGWSTPMVLDFIPVTAGQVRYRFDNCGIEHGWLYEVEVYHTR